MEITVNGITYTVKSNNEGYATLPVNLKPKTYIITSKYKGFILKNTVNVKNTLKAKKTFKVKKSTKKIVLKATLKWSNKTAIAKKKRFHSKSKVKNSLKKPTRREYQKLNCL
ncbi:MAG: hypothetical protein E7Z80_05860 [Methanobrevibacter thaueri]|nr:hypothetical protein [Methanobrevibacter thaueri]